MIFWGLSFIWYKQAYPEFRPISLVLFRLVISFVLLFIYTIFQGKLKLPKVTDLKYFFLLAFCEPLTYFLGESFGMQLVSSTLASILIATIPLITSFIAFYLYKEQLGLRRYFGILLSFLGVVFVVYFDGSIGAAPFKGIILMMLAVVSAACYSIVLKRLSIVYSALIIVCYQNLIGIIYFLPIFLVYDAPVVNWKIYSMHDFLPVIYLAVFASTLAFLFFIRGVQKLGVSKAIVFTNFIPIVTALCAGIMLNEKMSFIKITGILLTISGLLLTQISLKLNLESLKEKWKG